MIFSSCHRAPRSRGSRKFADAAATTAAAALLVGALLGLHVREPPDGMTRVFVYGTLKRGFANYQRYLSNAEACGQARYCGPALTCDDHALIVVPEGNMPPGMMEGGGGQQVEGQVFDVDERTLRALDILEGLHTGRYYRKELPVFFQDDPQRETFERTAVESATEVLCAAYLYPSTPELLALDRYGTYSRELQDAHYTLRELNREIAALCAPPADGGA